MSIKAVIWDIGGVILRTEDHTPREQLAKTLGVTRAELEALVFGGDLGRRAQLGEITPKKLWGAVRAELNLPPGAHSDISERFFAGDEIDYILVDFIRSLRTRYRTGIISNAWKNLSSALTRWEIADAFEVVVGSAEEGIMKPGPLIYHLALERFSIAPDEAVFIDDFVHNIEGAQQVGMHGILFVSREQVLADLKELL